MTTSDIDRPGDPGPVREIRIAAAAAAAARATPGVAHLQPGLWGLVQQLGTELWTRVTGQPRPDTAGIEVRIDGDAVTIEVTLVADGRRAASATAGEVQRNVHRAVHAAHDIAPRRIAVHVVDIAF